MPRKNQTQSPTKVEEAQKSSPQTDGQMVNGGLSKSAKKRAKKKMAAEIAIADCEVAMELKQRITGLNEQYGALNSTATSKALSAFLEKLTYELQDAKRYAPKAAYKGSAAQLRRELAELEASDDQAALDMADEIRSQTLPRVIEREAVDHFIRTVQGMYKKVETRLQESAGAAQKAKEENARIRQAEQVVKLKAKAGGCSLTAEEALQEITSSELRDIGAIVLQNLSGPLGLAKKVEQTFGVICQRNGGQGSFRSATLVGFSEDVGKASKFLRGLDLSASEVHTFGHPADARRVVQQADKFEKKGVFVAYSSQGSSTSGVLFAGPREEVTATLAACLEEVEKAAKARQEAKDARTTAVKKASTVEKDVRDSSLKTSADKARVVIGEGGQQVRKFESAHEISIRITLPRSEEESTEASMLLVGKKAAVEEGKAALEAFIKSVKSAEVPASKDAMARLYRRADEVGQKFSDLRATCGHTIVRKDTHLTVLGPADLDATVASLKELVDLAEKLGQAVQVPCESGAQAKFFQTETNVKDVEKESGAKLRLVRSPRSKGKGKGKGKGSPSSLPKIEISGEEEAIAKAKELIAAKMQAISAPFEVTGECILEAGQARAVIGFRGTTVQKIQTDSETQIRVDMDSNKVTINGPTQEAVDKAIALVKAAATSERAERPAAPEGKGKGKGAPSIEGLSSRGPLLGSSGAKAPPAKAAGKGQPKKFDLEASMKKQEFPTLGGLNPKANGTEEKTTSNSALEKKEEA